MLRFIFRAIAVVFLASVGYAVYDANRAGYFELPELPDGAYPISFPSGLRGIILDAEVIDPSVGQRSPWLRRLSDASPNRRYLGLPLDVPEWVVGSWSYCTSATDAERNKFAASIPEEIQRQLTGARFDYTCRLDLDNDEELVTGLIFSVPKL